MRTVIFCTLVIAVTIGTVTILGAGMQKKSSQSKQDSTSSKIESATSKGLQFSAEIEKEDFSPNELIVLKVSVKNTTQMTYYLPDTYHPEWDYNLEVKNEKRENVPLTADGERLINNIAIFRQVNKEIAPGTELHRDFQISKLFKMTAPGLYAVTVKHRVWEPKSGAFSTITSNIVKVRIK